MCTHGLVAALGLLAGLAPVVAWAEEPYCGNGVVEANEACDLGIGNEVGRYCTVRCTEPRCGDGELDLGEACDDGNLVDRDGCSAACLDEWQPRWTSTFDTGAPLGEQFAAVALTPAGPVAVGSYASDITSTAPLVVGFDHEGGRRFSSVIGSAPGSSGANAIAAVAGEGGVVVVGALADADGSQRPMVWRYEADGARRYAVRLELGSPSGSADAVVAVSSAQAFVAGNHVVVEGGAAGWIGELDPRDGSLAWSLPLESGRRVLDLALAPGGYLVAVGSIGNTATRIWVGAFELDGTMRWIRDQPPWVEGLPSAASSVVVAADGSIYATGLVGVGVNDTTMALDIDLWVGAFDSEGMPRWSRLQAGAAAGPDVGSDIVLDLQGRPLVVGTLQTQPLAASTFFDRDAWVGQYDVDGEVQWTWRYDGPLRVADEGEAMAITAEGALVLAGSTSVRRQGNDALLLELLPPTAPAARRMPGSVPRPFALREPEREPEPLALDERGPHRATLQVELDGGVLRPGDRGSVLEVPCVQSELPYPGLALDEQSVQSLLDRVATVMSPYGVAVYTDDEALPPHLPRTTVLVGALAEQLGLDPAAAGYSCVVDCGDRWSWDLAFAFARDLPTIANTVLHEAAHTWGLDHVLAQDLLMYPLGSTADATWGERCVAVSDATSPPQCLEHHERWCPPGQQSSHAELLAAFGPAVIDVEPPLVEIVAPAPGQRLAPGEPLALELHVEDDDGDPGYRVVVPELEWERVIYDGTTALSLALPPGVFTVRVEAIDHARNESEVEVEVLVGEALPPRVPGGEDGGDEDGEGEGEGDEGDEPLSGRLDDGCRVGGRGTSGWVGAFVMLLVVGGRSRRR